VIGVEVEASGREVPSWTQPLVAPFQPGFLGVLTRVAKGQMELLVQTRSSPGYGGATLVFPTVTTDDPTKDPLARLFRDPVPMARVRFDATNSEEGGRFFHFDLRFMIVEAEAGTPIDVLASHRWCSLGDLHALCLRGRVSMELRNLLACVPHGPRGT
jgi:oxidase EvaA